MEDGNNPIQHASGSEIIKHGDIVQYRDGRVYPTRIEDVTHFRTAGSGDYEHPIGTLFGMHDKTMYDLYGYSTLGRRQHSTNLEDEELSMIDPQHKKRTQRVSLLYMLLLFAAGVAAALIIQHFTWGQLN